MKETTETETETALKPKVSNDDLVEMLQLKADAGEIKTAASGLKSIREDGLRVAQKRVYVAFKSVVITAAAEDEPVTEDEPTEDTEAIVAEETEDWNEEE